MLFPIRAKRMDPFHAGMLPFWQHAVKGFVAERATVPAASMGYIASMATGIRQRAAGRTREPLFLEQHIAKKEWGDHANTELAKRTGRDRATIWKWRNAPHKLKEAHRAELAAALGLDGPDDLRRPPDRPSLDKMLDAAPAEVAADVYRYALGKLVNTKK